MKVIYEGKIIPLEFFVIKNGSYGIIGSPAMFIMGVEISFRRPFGVGVSALGGGASAPERSAPGGCLPPGGVCSGGSGPGGSGTPLQNFFFNFKNFYFYFYLFIF